MREWRRRGKLTACLMVKLRFSTLHVALENGSDLHVNERQKIRHYRSRSTGEKEEEEEESESVDSISRDERGFPLTQYITNGRISRARYTITHFKHHHRVLRLISNRMSV